LDDPAVLTTLPATLTSAATELDVLEFDEVVEVEPPEQAASRAQDNPMAAIAARLVGF
jgi:hypothetical protein